MGDGYAEVSLRAVAVTGSKEESSELLGGFDGVRVSAKLALEALYLAGVEGRTRHRLPPVRGS